MTPRKVFGGSTFQDIGTQSLPFDVRVALYNLGNIYYGSSLKWENVVKFQEGSTDIVNVICDVGYYTGVFDSLIYKYFINNTQPQRTKSFYYHNGNLEFEYYTYFPPVNQLKHLSEASCCFRAFISIEDFTHYQTTLLEKVSNHGTLGKFLLCKKNIKPRRIILDQITGKFYYA